MLGCPCGFRGTCGPTLGAPGGKLRVGAPRNGAAPAQLDGLEAKAVALRVDRERLLDRTGGAKLDVDLLVARRGIGGDAAAEIDRKLVEIFDELGNGDEGGPPPVQWRCARSWRRRSTGVASAGRRAQGAACREPWVGPAPSVWGRLRGDVKAGGPLPAPHRMPWRGRRWRKCERMPRWRHGLPRGSPRLARAGVQGLQRLFSWAQCFACGPRCALPKVRCPDRPEGRPRVCILSVVLVRDGGCIRQSRTLLEWMWGYGVCIGREARGPVVGNQLKRTHRSSLQLAA